MAQDMALTDEEVQKIEKNIINRMKERSIGRPTCPYCDTDMEIRFSSISKNPYHEDLQFKCPNCRNHQSFGIPVRDEVEYETIKKNRGGRRYDAVKSPRKVNEVDMDYSDEEVREKLSDKGYLIGVGD